MGQIVSFDGYKPPARFDNVAWTQARISEAPGSTGPWAVIDTVSLGAPDPDPANPQPRSFTTDNGTAPDLWYRVEWLDGLGGQSAPTAAVQNSDSDAPLFATSDDLAGRLGLTFTADEAARVNALLGIASGLIQQEAKQTIALVVDDVLSMPGRNDDRITLPERPVVSVASVSIDGLTLTPEVNWYLEGNTIVRGRGSILLDGFTGQEIGSFDGLSYGFGWPTQTLEIVYTHGYAAIPETVKAICMEAVVRVWVNPGTVARESIGNESVVYDNNRFSPSGLLLTDSERLAIRRLFGRRAGSISMSV